jgi:hypothetical protein
MPSNDHRCYGEIIDGKCIECIAAERDQYKAGLEEIVTGREKAKHYARELVEIALKALGREVD